MSVGRTRCEGGPPKNNIILTLGTHAHALRRATATAFSSFSTRFCPEHHHGAQGLNRAPTHLPDKSGCFVDALRPWWCSGQKRAKNVEKVVAGALRRARACGSRIMFRAFSGSWVDLLRSVLSVHPLLSGCTQSPTFVFRPLPKYGCIYLVHTVHANIQ